MIRKWAVGYGVAGGVFLLLDLLWLGIVVPSVYRPELGALLRDDVIIPAALAFYVMYVGGMMILAVLPGLKAQSLLTAVAMGAMLGLVAYGTYDLTNLATLKGWSLKVTLIDMTWGSFVTAMASGSAYLSMRPRV